MNDLNKKAWRGIVFLALVMGLLLFVPAGTIRYWQAWVYLTVYSSSSLLVTIYLMRNNPALLARRLRAGPRAEKEATQKIIMVLASTAFVALLIVPGLDHRFGWSRVPTFAVLAANLMVAVGLYTIFIVYKANPFTSATIQVEKDQKVISTGPYSIVRHPMYSGGLVMLLGTPLALGSWWGLLVLIPMLPILIWRLLGEEEFLSKNLPGYTEYCMKVRSRLIPGIY